MPYGTQETGRRALALQAAMQMREWIGNSFQVKESVKVRSRGQRARSDRDWFVTEEGYLRVLYPPDRRFHMRRGAVIANEGRAGPYLFDEVNERAVQQILTDYPLVAEALGKQADPKLLREAQLMTRPASPASLGLERGLTD